MILSVVVAIMTFVLFAPAYGQFQSEIMQPNLSEQGEQEAINNKNDTEMTEEEKIAKREKFYSEHPDLKRPDDLSSEAYEQRRQNEASNASASQEQWKTHSDRTLGIEFHYPPNWEVKEKTNRFEAGPDLTVEEMSGLDSFGVSTVDDIGGLDAELAATVGQNRLTEGADTRLIEGVEEHTPVGGEEAYSFTYTQGSEFLEAVQEAITVIHDDRGYIFAFTGTTLTFDEPENVEIKERMLGSLQFLDGGESDAGEDEDSTGDEEEEENGD